MVVLLYAIDPLHPWSKEVGPIEGGNNGTAILSRDQLCVVTLSRLIHNLCNGLQAAHLRPPVLAFEKPKAPVRRELSVSNW